ncbi:unannotated protein [freshwater metagenome]|uniref:Unannotated protein n=1 Tax=freshwater metagenome TaxID=449393 RepID=A0A6J7AIL4_9ZZZZ
MQFGFEIIPLGRFLISCGLTSGTISGTSASIRNAPELSTTTAPRAAAIGAHSAEISSGTSNIATSMPSKASGDSATTVSSWPRHISFFPALRAEAIKRISPHTSLRSDKILSMTVPTAPVAPTTANDGFFIGQCLHRQGPRCYRHRAEKQYGPPLPRALNQPGGR